MKKKAPPSSPKKKQSAKPRSRKDNKSFGAESPEDHAQQFPDPFALSQALMNAYQKSQPLFLEMLERYNTDFVNTTMPAPASLSTARPIDTTDSTIDFLQSMAMDPLKYWSMQLGYAQKQIDLLQNSMKKFSGEKTEPVISPPKGDKRFQAPEWEDSALFDFIKQYYLLASEHVQRTIDSAQDLPPEKKEELSFTARLMIDALSPTNFLMTNPEVLNETVRTGGENLVKGFQHFSEDLQRSHGPLKISMSKADAFTLGKNIAVTPGSVVYENDLIQLIQYKPAGKTTFQKPLLIVPPWINKYYILDLRPENSFIKWAVEQGHSVFCISWVNPGEALSSKSFEDYMREGFLDALEQVLSITGETSCNTLGYCLGGTLLAIGLAYLAAQKQAGRVESATFLTTLVDFEHAGELKLFMGDGQIEAMEQAMKNKGLFSGRDMQQTFSLLRANDLIWSFVINNYLMGREPFPFDLLYWNDDTTNMPAAMHSFYLKNMYRDNFLAIPGGIEMGGVKIDISKIETPCYFLSAKEDHIAPWKATYRTTQMVSGPKCFTLTASGHVAGVVNPPARNKYCYWSDDRTPEDPDAWMARAHEHPGSWWTHWQGWLAPYAGDMRPAYKIADPVEPAPGRYVRMRAG